MSLFTECNTAESFVRDLLCGTQPFAGRVAETSPAYVPAGRNKHRPDWQGV